MAPKKTAQEATTEVQKQIGSASFGVTEKLNGVFGQFSSLEVHVGLSLPGDPANFEAEIDKFLPRVVKKIQTTMNQIAVGSGFQAPWKEEATPAPKA